MIVCEYTNYYVLYHNIRNKKQIRMGYFFWYAWDSNTGTDWSLYDYSDVV